MSVRARGVPDAGVFYRNTEEELSTGHTRAGQTTTGHPRTSMSNEHAINAPDQDAAKLRAAGVPTIIFGYRIHLAMVRSYTVPSEIDWRRYSFDMYYGLMYKDPVVAGQFRAFYFRSIITACTGSLYAIAIIMCVNTSIVSSQYDGDNPLWYLASVTLFLAMSVDMGMHLLGPVTPTAATVRMIASLMISVAAIGMVSWTMPFIMTRCDTAWQLPSFRGRITYTPEEQRRLCMGIFESYQTAAVTLCSLGALVYPVPHAFVSLFHIILCLVVGRKVAPILGSEDYAGESTGAIVMEAVMVILPAFGATAITHVRFSAGRSAFEATIKVELQRREAATRAAKLHKLLSTIVPAAVLPRLENGGPEQFYIDDVPSASMLFADVECFTAWSSARSAESVTAMLNTIVGVLDSLAVETPTVEKVKTVGDAYWAVSGIPEQTHQHADHMVSFGWRMNAAVEALSAAHPEWGDVLWRVAIHSGPMTGALFGERQISYEVFGETSRITQQVEANGLPGALVGTGQTLKAMRHLPAPTSIIPHKTLANQGPQGGPLMLFIIHPPESHALSSSALSLQQLVELTQPSPRLTGSHGPHAADLDVDEPPRSDVRATPQLQSTLPNVNDDSDAVAMLRVDLSDGLPVQPPQLPPQPDGVSHHEVRRTPATTYEEDNTLPMGPKMTDDVNDSTTPRPPDYGRSSAEEPHPAAPFGVARSVTNTCPSVGDAESATDPRRPCISGVASIARWTTSQLGELQQPDAGFDQAAFDELAKPKRWFLPYFENADTEAMFKRRSEVVCRNMNRVASTLVLAVHCGYMASLVVLPERCGSPVGTSLQFLALVPFFIALVFSFHPTLSLRIASAALIAAVFTGIVATGLTALDGCVPGHDTQMYAFVAFAAIYFSVGPVSWPELFVVQFFAVAAPSLVLALFFSPVVVGNLANCPYAWSMTAGMAFTEELLSRRRFVEEQLSARAESRLALLAKDRIEVLQRLVPEHVVSDLITWFGTGMDPQQSITRSYQRVVIAFMQLEPAQLERLPMLHAEVDAELMAICHDHNKATPRNAMSRRDDDDDDTDDGERTDVNPPPEPPRPPAVSHLDKIKTVGDIVMVAGPFPHFFSSNLSPLSSIGSSSAVLRRDTTRTNLTRLRNGTCNYDVPDDVDDHEGEQGVSSSSTLNCPSESSERGPLFHRAHAIDVPDSHIIAAFDAVVELFARVRTKCPVRLGAHVGPVVGTVQGSSRLAFDVFGDPVNVASRVMTSAVAKSDAAMRASGTLADFVTKARHQEDTSTGGLSTPEPHRRPVSDQNAPREKPTSPRQRTITTQHSTVFGVPLPFTAKGKGTIQVRSVHLTSVD